MYRRWRVRHSYPKPVVDLVERLLSKHPVAELSRVLDLPMSVIYRWRARKFGRSASAAPRASGETVGALLTQCDQLGFRFTERLASIERPEWLPIQVARRGFDQEVSSSVNAARTHSGDAGLQAATSALAAASEDQRGTDVAYHRTESMECECNVADVHVRKTSRGVTRRLEAARRLIDTEYFSAIDSKVLADAAQMSRHHFIRMFSHAFGISPHQYLTRTRIGAAKRLLLSSREPIEVVAVGVGFRSGPSLNRAFKQIEGASVSQFCKMIHRHAATTPLAARATGAADRATSSP